ncbi:lipid II flippase family protein [Emticicia sp. BO119]|uniref:lipid II flippase family protein n=1 Tax=Emticicia sp. BO119 TaxID=2757768 RepID=UPI0015F0A020|nr:DUF2837 family protein [Emticicia sp. BO119]MBA4853047.1 DUF2837 family protein [Emticicia sp. BO119]
MIINIVLLLTFFIHFFSIAVLSVRLVGIRTSKMAASYAVYNIIFLAVRFLNTFQAPLLAKSIEKSILNGQGPDNWLFFKLCLVSLIGSISGALFIPTLQRTMYQTVEKVYQKNSLIRVIVKSFTFDSLRHFLQSFSVPRLSNISRLNRISDIPKRILLMNVIITSLTTISVLSCLYAGYINPDLRTTSLSLNGFIVGFSTVLSMIIVEPNLGITADKVINGLYSETYFRRYLTFVVIARIIGTGLSLLFILPLAHLVVFLAKLIYV